MADANDARQLAEDIVTCVIQRRRPEWVPSGTYQKGKDILQYRTDILDFCVKNEIALKTEWWQYFNGKEKSVENYEKYCKVILTIVSNTKFSIGKLLVRVIKLAEYAARLNDCGCKGAPSAAILYIQEILLKFPEIFKTESAEKQYQQDLHL